MVLLHWCLLWLLLPLTSRTQKLPTRDEELFQMQIRDKAFFHDSSVIPDGAEISSYLFKDTPRRYCPCCACWFMFINRLHRRQPPSRWSLESQPLSSIMCAYVWYVGWNWNYFNKNGSSNICICGRIVPGDRMKFWEIQIVKNWQQLFLSLYFKQLGVRGVSKYAYL